MSSLSPGSLIDVREILAMLWRRKWLLILPVPLAAAMALGLTYLMEPEYESTSIIQIDPEVQLIGEVQRLIGEPSGMNVRRDRSGTLRSMFNEITSSHFADLLNQRMQLTRQPDIQEEALEIVQMQPHLDAERARLSVLQTRLKEAISLEWASSDQIKIIVNSTSARLARDMANHLSDIFIAEKIKQDLSQIRTSQDFSDVQLERYNRQVNDKMAEITRVEQQLARLRNAEGTSSETNRTEIRGEIDQTEREIQDLRGEERAVLQKLRQVSGLDANELALQTSVEKENTRQELVDRLRQIDDLLGQRVWSDPQVINFKLRQNNLLESIEDENERLVSNQYGDYDEEVRTELVTLFNTRDRLDYLYTKKPYLESVLTDLAPSTDRIPELESRLNQLERELQVATDIRDGFSRQQESSTISQALVENRSSIKYRQVEPAKLAVEPVSPNRKKILLMGIFLGIAIGGAAVLLVELMDNSFKKVEQVEEILGVKVIGVCPKIEFTNRLAN